MNFVTIHNSYNSFFEINKLNLIEIKYTKDVRNNSVLNSSQSFWDVWFVIFVKQITGYIKRYNMVSFDSK